MALIRLKIKVDRLLTTVNGFQSARTGVAPKLRINTLKTYARNKLLAFLENFINFIFHFPPFCFLHIKKGAVMIFLSNYT